MEFLELDQGEGREREKVMSAVGDFVFGSVLVVVAVLAVIWMVYSFRKGDHPND